MPKYWAMLENTVSTVVTVELPEGASEKEVLNAAMEGDLPSLCHQCVGGERYSQNMEFSGEWHPVADGQGNAEPGTVGREE